MAYPDKLLQLVSTSVCEFFASVGAADVAPIAAANAPKSQGAPGASLFSASLGFTGEHIKGALVVIADTALLAATNPQREFVPALADADHSDWIGEMANQIVGALKRHASGYKIDFLLSTPTVVRGKELELAASHKETAAVMWHKVGAHTSRVHFSATLGPAATFAGEPETAPQAAGGDTLLF